MRCPNCNYEGTTKGLGIHWGHTPDHRPVLSDTQHEIVTGLLMGDGHLNRSSKSPKLRAEMVNKEYLEYLDAQFPQISLGVRKSRTAEEQSETHRTTGFNLDANTDSYSDCYWWETFCNDCLTRYEDWYESGRKVFPEELELTPTALKHWYVCDGFLSTHSNIVIYLDNEKKNKEKINEYFSRYSVDPVWEHTDRGSRSFTRIRFRKDDSLSLFDEMGDQLPGFGEKWVDRKI